MHFLFPELINILKFIRNFMEFFGEMNINGFPLDWVFHLIVAFLLMLILTKFITPKKSLLIVCFLIILKEVVDIFGKSRLEYIVPPAIDMPKDIIAGLLGIFLYFKHRKYKKKRKERERKVA
jgi:hypothetical protein